MLQSGLIVARQATKHKLFAATRAWPFLSHGRTIGGNSAARFEFLRHIIGRRFEHAAVNCSIAVLALAFVAIASSRLHLNLAAVGMLFVIVIVLLARVADFPSSVVVSIIASLWLVYIAPPDYSSRIHVPFDVVAVVSFLIVSWTIAWLVSRLREMSGEAHSSVNRKLLDAEERVRTRIGKELHDDIEQRLALLAVQAARGSGDSSSLADTALSSVQRIQEEASRISADVQALAYELRPYKLEYLGLAPVMKSFCEKFAKQHNVEIEFKCHDLGNAPPLDISFSMMRVLQEALHNSVQHTEAHHIGVELFGTSEAIHLTIHDSGAGFNPQAAVKGPGLGLVSMQERIKLVNGEFSIRSQPGKGSTVHACVPLLKRPTENFQRAFRISPPVAAMATTAVLLAIAIEIAQAHYPATSNVLWASAMPSESNQYLAPNAVSVSASQKIPHHEKNDPLAPSAAFRRVQSGPHEVDYVAEDVTIRYFAPRPTETRLGSGGKRLNTGRCDPTYLGKVDYVAEDVTIRYFATRPTGTRLGSGGKRVNTGRCDATYFANR